MPARFAYATERLLQAWRDASMQRHALSLKLPESAEKSAGGRPALYHSHALYVSAQRTGLGSNIPFAILFKYCTPCS
jgi:hypothetical protein